MKIIAVHILNDFSGSPRVLATVLQGLVDQGVTVTLLTETKTNGALSGLPVRYVRIPYRFFQWIPSRLLMMFYTQVALFVRVLFLRKENAYLYINTSLPVGAALAAKITGQKVVFHLHEATVPSKTVYQLTRRIIQLTADHIFYVSAYHRDREGFPCIPGVVVPNALPDLFFQKASSHHPNGIRPFRVLMPASLKDYKGIPEFVQLANLLPQQDFELVLNADQDEIDGYFRNTQLPSNLQVYSRQADMHPFYKRASLVVNLSRPEAWIESFGMTLLEGMAYGLPVIAPPVGGPAELIRNGCEGFTMDGKELPKMATAIQMLVRDEQRYQSMSHNARIRAAGFRQAHMLQAVTAGLYSLQANSPSVLKLPAAES